MKAFLGLIIGLTIPAFLVGLGFRYKGLAQRYKALEHPLNDKAHYLIAHQAGSGEKPANTWEAIDNTIENTPNAVIWLDVHQTQDGKIILLADDMLEWQTNGSGHILLTTWDKVKNLDAGYKFKEGPEDKFRGQGIKIRTLEDTLTKYKDSNFVLNIKANTPKIDLEISSMLKKHGASKKVIISSPYEVILKTIRAQIPLGMYTIGFAEFTRLNMFDSLNLSPAIPVKGDIFITNRKLYNRSMSPSLIAEIQRRKKKAVVFSDNLDEWKKWKSIGADGLLTRHPSRFKGSF